MSNSLGIDFILNNGDIDFSNNGDFLTTKDIEDSFPIEENLYEGYICLKETIYRIITAVKGSYPFDKLFGADIDLYILRDIRETFSNIRNVLEVELLRDDRIKSVEAITFRQIDDRRVDVYIKVVPIGREKSSQFVYPYNIN